MQFFEKVKHLCKTLPEIQNRLIHINNRFTFLEMASLLKNKQSGDYYKEVFRTVHFEAMLQNLGALQLGQNSKQKRKSSIYNHKTIRQPCG